MTSAVGLKRKSGVESEDSPKLQLLFSHEFGSKFIRGLKCGKKYLLEIGSVYPTKNLHFYDEVRFGTFLLFLTMRKDRLAKLMNEDENVHVFLSCKIFAHRFTGANGEFKCYLKIRCDYIGYEYNY